MSGHSYRLYARNGYTIRDGLRSVPSTIGSEYARRFLTTEQKNSYGRFHGESNDVQLARYFHLDETDFIFINKHAIKVSALLNKQQPHDLRWSQSLHYAAELVLPSHGRFPSPALFRP